MVSKLRLTGASLAFLLLAATAASAQQTTLSGRVTNEAGNPLPSASVFLDGMSIGTITRDDGRYSIIVPAARVNGQSASLVARLIGYKSVATPVTLAAGTPITHDFVLASNPLKLGEIVVTGTGTSASAEKLGNVRNHVDSTAITNSNESNIVEGLAGKAPNVEVTESSGEPGAGSYIRIRGTRSLASGNSQPLFVVDGVPIDNSSYSTTNFNPNDGLGSGEIEGTAQANRASDINPNDIENVEILKGAAAGALYGARAGQGVILITTKSGKAGATRYSAQSKLSFDKITKRYPLQTQFGQGYYGLSPQALNADGEGNPDPAACDDISNFFCRTSWGPDLSTTGEQVYDHANEAYVTGHTTDNNLSVSGGNDRTSFFLSGAYLYDRGVFQGPNNNYQRSTVRLKATQKLTDRLSVGGNVSFADARGNYVERGNTTDGLQLGLLRTPPNWNNQPYKGENGQITFRFQHPTAADQTSDRGWNNPFWTLNEGTHNSQLGRAFGNLNADFDASDWLKINYVLGGDYYTDERLEGAPQGSAGTGGENVGRITEGKIVNYELNQNFTATASHTFSPGFSGTFTLGNTLDDRHYRQLSDVGRTLIAPQPYNLLNTVTRDPTIDAVQEIRNIGFFGQATADLFDQLFLTGALRNDGSSTYDRTHLRAWFPKASAAWTFTKALPIPGVSFGKLRAAYGEAGQEPLPYLTTQTFASTAFATIAQGVALTPTYGGFGGLASSIQKATPSLLPERTRELEAGADFGFFKDMADLGLTYYRATTSNVILTQRLASSSGYFQQVQQGAKFRNTGFELTANVRPITRQNFTWEVGAQWARNRSNALELLGAAFVALDPNYNTPQEVAIKGEPIGVMYDFGFAKCGISPGGAGAVVAGVDMDQACAGAPHGALYIDQSGFPVLDPNQRIIGDPNPKWTGSLHSSMQIKKFSFSALLDLKHGGSINNGTRGALQAYGTHKSTAERADCTFDVDGNTVCSGNLKTFGTKGWYDGPVVGPGAGTAVPIGVNWYSEGPLFFAGNNEAFQEDGSYAKLREISIGYSFDNRFVKDRLGLTSVDVRLAGRNLKTWSNYTGYDPETNLGGATGHSLGLDYFNQPQARSFIITLGLNR
ncbi:MAG: SusC/RagA family TonB-linked outer membrane protein [Gemmatimonadota bacterium]